MHNILGSISANINLIYLYLIVDSFFAFDFILNLMSSISNLNLFNLFIKKWIFIVAHLSSVQLLKHIVIARM